MILTELLAGKRTYIIAIAVGVLTTLHWLGYIDGATYQALLGLLGAGGLATLRAAVK